MKKENKLLNAEKNRIIRVSITLILLLLMIYILEEQIDNINVLELMRVFREESNSVILIMAIAGLLAVSFTTLYDFVLCKDLHIEGIRKGQIFKISWIANTINNFIGFGGVSGSGLRTAFYKSNGVKLEKAVSMSVIIWMSALSGLSALVWLNIKFLFSISNIFCLIFSILLALYIPIYLFSNKFIKKIPFLGNKLVDKLALELPRKIKIHMILVAMLDWIIAGMFFTTLIMYFVGDVTISQGLAIFTLATAIGTCSFIPGGLGVFELVCLYGFNLISVDITMVLLAILIYRIFYFVVPCILALFILIEEFISKKFKSKLNMEQLSLTNDLGVKALSSIVFLSGILLILSACLPVIVYKHKILSDFLHMPMLQFSQLSIMGIGIILIMLSRGISKKVKLAYYITSIFLILGALLSLIKGVDIQSALWLIIVAILLYLSKDRFYRESSPLKIKNIFMIIIVIICATFIYGIVYNSLINNHFLKTHIKHIHSLMYTPRSVFYFLIIMSFIILILRLLIIKRPVFKNPTEEDMCKLETFLKKYGGNSKSHLLFLKDKVLFYSQNDEVLIPFRVVRDKAIILGDPIGNKTLIAKAISDFRKYLDQYNMIPIFYEVEEEFLPLYHENGYTFLKLGEEAVIDLETFNLDGKAKQDLRTINNKMKKGVLSFEILKPPFDEKLLNRLEDISEQWLGDRKEKGFSIGWFDRDYLNKAPIAIIKKEDEIVGFATLAPMYDNEGLTIDLMRIIPKPPNGAMDGLFLGIIAWARENGYKKFSLGVAPLSNVGVSEFARTSEKIAKNIYKYGGRFYKFSGLRKYKEKFSPQWSSRYLAYPKKIDLPITIVDVVRMVSNSHNN